jgi:hypothetical protein
MDTVLIFAGGRRVNALILSASTDCLRVVIPGHNDTEEFHMVEGGWLSDRGERMEIGALLSIGSAASCLLPQTRVRTLTA